MLLIVLTLLILSILYITLKEYNYIKDKENIKNKNNKNIKSQIVEWCNNEFKIKEYQKDELFNKIEQKKQQNNKVTLATKVANFVT